MENIKKYITNPQETPLEQKTIQKLRQDMEYKLKKLEKVGSLTKNRYYSLEGSNIYLKLEIQGFLNGHRVSASTHRDEIKNMPEENKKFKWTKQRMEKFYTQGYLKIDGVNQPEEVRREFIKTYVPIAYDLDVEKELEEEIEYRQERLKQLNVYKAEKILF